MFTHNIYFYIILQNTEEKVLVENSTFSKVTIQIPRHFWVLLRHERVKLYQKKNT